MSLMRATSLGLASGSSSRHAATTSRKAGPCSLVAGEGGWGRGGQEEGNMHMVII